MDPNSQPPQFANYPRPGHTPNPFMRLPGVYFEAIGEAWKLIQQEMGTWVLCTVILFALQMAFQIPLAFVQNGGNLLRAQRTMDLGTTLSTYGISFLLGCLYNVMVGGLVRMGARQAQGLPISVGDMFAGFSRFGIVFGAAVISTIAMYLGFILCIIPGFYVAGALAMVPVLAVDQNVGSMDAVQKCWERCKSHAWALCGLLFVLGLIQIAGVLACCVGLLFTIPIYFVTLGMHYNYFFPPAQYVSPMEEFRSSF